MSGRRTDSPAAARRQTQLIRSIIYDVPVLNQSRNPLEWFLSVSPDPLLAPPRPILDSVPQDYPGAGPSADFPLVLLLTHGSYKARDLFLDNLDGQLNH